MLFFALNSDNLKIIEKTRNILKMDSVEQFIDNPGLSHIGKQILSFLEVDDLWILRQVSKKWKIMADADLKKLKDYCIQLDFEWCKKYNQISQKYLIDRYI